MDVSPKTLREVEFREKMRGYHPEDVDQFLERVAASVEVMQDRLRQAVERAQRAEQAAAEAGGADEALRRTLVLAQRTADLAVQEAREQAARILAGAEQQAQAILADADERAQRAHDDALVEARAELTRLEASRAHLQAEVDTLTRWVEEHRTHLSMALQEALSRIEQADLLSPPPSTRSAEPASRSGGVRPGAPPTPDAARAPTGAPGSEADSAGPATVAWQPGAEPPPPEGDPPADARPAGQAGEGDPYIAELRRAVNEPEPLGPREDQPTADPPGDEANGEFYDQDVGDSRRLGRLRRRH
jgi:cell division initiation protein